MLPQALILDYRQPVTKKKVIELGVGGWLGNAMCKAGWGGFTLPLPWLVLIFYWAPYSVDILKQPLNPYVRVHEFVHVAQDERNFCFLVTWWRYLWALVRLGYRNNPYETEAYVIERAWWDISDLPDWATQP